MIEGLRPYPESAKTKPMTRTTEINIPWLTSMAARVRLLRWSETVQDRGLGLEPIKGASRRICSRSTARPC